MSSLQVGLQCNHFDRDRRRVREAIATGFFAPVSLFSSGERIYYLTYQGLRNPLGAPNSQFHKELSRILEPGE